MLLGASNTWFPVTRSALTIPTAYGEIVKVLEAYAEALEYGRDARRPRRTRCASTRPCGAGSSGSTASTCGTRSSRGSPPAATAANPDDLLRPEWETFVDPASAIESEDFRLRESVVPASLAGRVARVVVAERLREVIALCGFTRIESPEGVNPGDADGPAVAALANRPPTWVPAAESRGEGIFIQLDEEAVSRWEAGGRRERPR